MIGHEMTTPSSPLDVLDKIELDQSLYQFKPTREFAEKYRVDLPGADFYYKHDVGYLVSFSAHPSNAQLNPPYPVGQARNGKRVV
jgi:hypothetical protein